MRTLSTRKQAIVRFDEELMAWITKQAKSRNKSFNAFMIEIVREKKEEVERMKKLRIPEKISPDILALCGVIEPFSGEEISSDPRLEHIMRGHE